MIETMMSITSNAERSKVSETNPLYMRANEWKNKTSAKSFDDDKLLRIVKIFTQLYHKVYTWIYPYLRTLCLFKCFDQGNIKEIIEAQHTKSYTYIYSFQKKLRCAAVESSKKNIFKIMHE